jgi:hypothetical protein
MKNSFSREQFFAAITAAGVKISDTNIGKINEQLDAMQPGIDHMDLRVVKRTLLAKGLGFKEASKALSVDTSEITVVLGPRQELGDEKGQPYWSINRLRGSRYSDINYTEAEAEALIKERPSLEAFKNVLTDKYEVPTKEPVAAE